MEKGRDKKWKAEKEIYIFYKVLCQRCIKFLIPPSGGGGGLIKGVGEEYQVGKRGRKYNGFGEEYNMEKGKGESISS